MVGSSHVVGANLLKTGLDFTSNPDLFETMVGRTLEFGIYLDLVQKLSSEVSFQIKGNGHYGLEKIPMVPPNPFGCPLRLVAVEVTQASGPFGTAISSLETPF